MAYRPSHPPEVSAMSTSRMPRAQRRTQLLELATSVFTQKGFQATSMDDIAAAAGVTKPVLYQHFDSKETLYVEVIDITARSLLEGDRKSTRLNSSHVASSYAVFCSKTTTSELWPS